MSGQDHSADLRDFAGLVMRAATLEDRSELAHAMRKRAAEVERQDAPPVRTGPAPEHRPPWRSWPRTSTITVERRRVTVEVRGPRTAFRGR